MFRLAIRFAQVGSVQRGIDGGTSLGMFLWREVSRMWKSIVLCVSLYGGAALGLVLGARFVEPAALPAAAVLGLCVIGVVLILAAPTSDAAIESETTQTVPTPTAGPRALPAPAETVRARTPTIPFEVVNS